MCDRDSLILPSVAGGCQTPSHPTPQTIFDSKYKCDPLNGGKTKVKLCGKEIEIENDQYFDDEKCERLAPDIVKLKWRKEHILCQQTASGKFIQCDRHSKARPRPRKYHENLNQSACTSFESVCSSTSFDSAVNSSDKGCSVSTYSCSHAVWSGWLKITGCGLAACFHAGEAWWCVLNIERTRARIDLIYLDASSGLTRNDRSIWLDLSSAVGFEKSMFACATPSRLSIKERGSGRQYRLACESPEAAEQLLSCLKALLEQIGGGV